MTEEQIALARRAVACKGWRWMPGMRYCSVAVAAETASPFSFNGYQRVGEDVDMVAYTDWVPCLPDVEDPATLGCLLALVREACGDDEAYAMPWHDEDGGWTVTVNDEDRCHNIAEGETEVEALVTALEEPP